VNIKAFWPLPEVNTTDYVTYLRDDQDMIAEPAIIFLKQTNLDQNGKLTSPQDIFPNKIRSKELIKEGPNKGFYKIVLQ